MAIKIEITEVISKARELNSIDDLIEYLKSINYVSMYKAARRLKTSNTVIKRIIKAENIEVKESCFVKNQFIMIKESDMYKIQDVLKKYQWNRETEND